MIYAIKYGNIHYWLIMRAMASNYVLRMLICVDQLEIPDPFIVDRIAEAGRRDVIFFRDTPESNESPRVLPHARVRARLNVFIKCVNNFPFRW